MKAASAPPATQGSAGTGRPARPGGRAADALLDQLARADRTPFALLHRPVSAAWDRIDLLVGEMSHVDRLAALPVPDHNGGRHAGGVRTGGSPSLDLLVLVPYRQITERGFDCRDDGTPLRALRVLRQDTLPLADVLRALPDTPTPIRDAGFDCADAEYAGLVRAVVAEEIGRGEGANFVLKRSFLATIEDYSVRSALALFGRLLRAERGAHWTFLVHTGTRTLVGASPERHVTLSGGTATMNPISGTYRYPATGATLAGLLEFLADRKESDELYMVLDEELKMMGRVCAAGGRVIGPRLKAMARLAHTEYFIEGHSSLDPREILRQTMFAPTVTGSPLENACRVIARYEPTGRGYYSGVLALLGRDGVGGQTLDSAILIRTADIDTSGRLRIDVGATLVRHSDPESEVAETRAKAAALLAALGGGTPTALPGNGPDAAGSGLGAAPGLLSSSGPEGREPATWRWHADVRHALEHRNASLSRFWLTARTRRAAPEPVLVGRRALVVDCEDNFTFMLAHQLRSLGLEVTVRRFDEPLDLAGHALVVLGPGPGDPRDVANPKISAMRRITRTLLARRTPLLAVCLGHQVLCGQLGLELVRRPAPNQGVQQEIDFFGRRERCGFYNTFAARSTAQAVTVAIRGGSAGLARDPGSGEIHALRGAGLWSLQFHPESVLTENGIDVLREVAMSLIAPVGTAARIRPSRGGFADR